MDPLLSSKENIIKTIRCISKGRSRLQSQRDPGSRLEALEDINDCKKDHDVARIETIACYHVLNPTSNPEPTELSGISSKVPTGDPG